MKKPIRVLIIEDSEDDASLVERELRKGGYEVASKRVEMAETMRAALDCGPWDLVISDHQMPRFSGPEALEVLRASGLDLPFIIVSGTIGEEEAVAAMKAGAHDYLMKGKLSRLVAVVERELGEAEQRRQRRLTEEALRESEARFRQIAETIREVFWMADPQIGKTLYVSPGYEKVWGRTCASLYENPKSFLDFVHPEDRERVVSKLGSRTDSRPFDQEYRIVRPDGAIRWIWDRGFPIKDKAGRVSHHVGVAQDITESKQAEARLRDSEALYYSLVQNLPQQVFRKDLAGRFTFANGPFCESLGQPLEGILGKTDRDFFPAEMAAKYQQDDHRVIATGQLLEGEEAHRQATGKSIFVHVIKTPLRDAAGEIIGVQGIAWDITEKKQLEANFLRAQRLEGIGTLASGIAHDLNNILAPILMSAGMLRSESKDETNRKLLNIIDISAKRGADIIKQLLVFGRGAEGERIMLNPGHLIKELRKIIQETFPKNLIFNVDIPNSLWPISANPTHFHQVMMNLCVNARDAMPQGGALTLIAENRQVDENCARMTPGAQPGPYVRLKVSDTGMGIPPENLDQIFDPFFTTKAIGLGTGLGLPTVLGIVKSHGGFITVSSQPGQGTEFDVFFPAVSGQTAPEPAPSMNAGPRGHGEMILVVDDEATIREALRMTLQNYGYQVMTAHEGSEAVGLYALHRQEIKAVISDLAMPGMDGLALTHVLTHMDPQLNIIISTGLGAETKVKELKSLGVKTILKKPYNAETVLNALQEALVKTS